jgi:hypothetical protein
MEVRIMERMWVQTAAHKYPKQWLVAVNLVCEQPGNRLIGDIFMVTDDEDEAYDKVMELRERGEMGEVMVVDGYDDTPQIGGLTICSQ